jgi:hypothetical protein
VIDQDSALSIIDQNVIKKLILEFESKYYRTNFMIVQHNFNSGLFEAYKTGVRLCRNEMIVFIHSDTIIAGNSELRKLVSAGEDIENVAVGHVNLPLSKEDASKINWQLASLLSATLYKKARGWNGSFDLVKKSAFESCDMREFSDFYTAGEDGMLMYLLSRLGKIPVSDASSYNYNNEIKISTKVLIRKRFQYAEAHGILLRKRAFSVTSLPGMLWRPISSVQFILLSYASVYYQSIVFFLVSLLPFLIVPYAISRKWNFVRFFLHSFVLELLSSFVVLWAIVKGFLTRNSKPKAKRSKSISYQIIFQTN